MLILILIKVQYLQNVAFSFEKVQVVKIIPCEIPTTRQKNPTQVNFPSTLPSNIIWKSLGKRPSLLKFVCLFQVEFNFSINNIFFRVVSWHQKYIDL